MYYQLGDATVDADFLSALKEKYKIVDLFVLKFYDKDSTLLREHLQKLKKEVFESKERIIVVQFDTDYYIDERVGINLINLFNVWREVDIPLSTMIYYTNNFGVSKEIEHICRYDHLKDRPMVIETFFNPGNYDADNHPKDLDINIQSIEHHGICMLRNPRSHKFALYNHIKHLDDRLVMSIKGVEE